MHNFFKRLQSGLLRSRLQECVIYLRPLQCCLFSCKTTLMVDYSFSSRLIHVRRYAKRRPKLIFFPLAKWTGIEKPYYDIYLHLPFSQSRRNWPEAQPDVKSLFSVTSRPNDGNSTPERDRVKEREREEEKKMLTVCARSRI